MNLSVLVRTFGTQVSRLVPAFVQASFVLMTILTLFSSQKVFGQVVPPGYLVDGYGFPFGNGGYDITGVIEVNFTNDIVPDINNLYPNNPTANPDRMCNAFCGTDDGYFDAGGVGEYRVGTKGIHGGNDGNIAAGNAGQPVLAMANGQVVAIFSVNNEYCEWGWVIVMKHYHADGDFYHSDYKHVTTADSIFGGVCDGPEDFTVAVGDWVMRGDTIARMGADYCVAGHNPHLHFEIRNSNLNCPFNGTMDDLYPRDNGRQAYGGIYCPEPCASSGLESGGITAEETANAYLNMQLDGVEDAWNFVADHRPSKFSIPEIEWQNTIGGTNYDRLSCIQQTSDGGYIVGGYSNSGISFDKIEISAQADYWILKLNNAGAIQWQNTIGGAGDDILTSIQQTSDGGYIVGGYSNSGISGDKTESCRGLQDYWVVKLTSTGDIQWQKTIGGSIEDFTSEVEQTLDGGYLVGGSSYSGISGDKIEANIGEVYAPGTADYWLVKLSSIGNIEWQNTIGGNYDEGLFDLESDSYGGYVIAGFSSSQISGDKTEGSLDSESAMDYWIVKVNSIGNIEWQNTIGGSGTDAAFNIKKTNEGNYLVAGFSDSEVSADKSTSTYGAWLLVIDDTGNILFQNSLAGASYNVFTMDKTNDGGYIIGYGATGIDFQIAKTDSDCRVLWQDTIGGSETDLISSIHQTSDNGYIVGGYSLSGISGDKTEASIGLYDYWIVKLTGTCIPSTEICNAIDDDCDGLVDEGITVDGFTISAFGPTTFCQGSSIALAASPTGGTYQWNKNGVPIAGATFIAYTANATGSYTCTTTVPCATATSAPIVVTVNKNPTATIAAGGATTFCAGGSVTLTVTASAGTTKQWYKGATLITGATGTTYVATTTGNYKCKVTKTATGCVKNSNTIAVSVPCREGEVVETSVKIFPNPTSGLLMIDIEDATSVSIVVSNMLGQTVVEQSTTSDCTIDLSGLPKGSYSVSVVSDVSVHSEIIILE